jgi:hypothetical protein
VSVSIDPWFISGIVSIVTAEAGSTSRYFDILSVALSLTSLDYLKRMFSDVLFMYFSWLVMLFSTLIFSRLSLDSYALPFYRSLCSTLICFLKSFPFSSKLPIVFWAKTCEFLEIYG